MAETQLAVAECCVFLEEHCRKFFFFFVFFLYSAHTTAPPALRNEVCTLCGLGERDDLSFCPLPCVFEIRLKQQRCGPSSRTMRLF